MFASRSEPLSKISDTRSRGKRNVRFGKRTCSLREANLCPKSATLDRVGSETFASESEHVRFAKRKVRFGKRTRSLRTTKRSLRTTKRSLRTTNASAKSAKREDRTSTPSQATREAEAANHPYRLSTARRNARAAEGSTRSVGPVFRPGTPRRPASQSAKRATEQAVRMYSWVLRPMRKSLFNVTSERTVLLESVVCRPLCGLARGPYRLPGLKGRAYRSWAAFGSSPSSPAKTPAFRWPYRGLLAGRTRYFDGGSYCGTLPRRRSRSSSGAA